MTPQLILRIVGIAALVVSALFTVLAVHYYLTNHIRAVMDDLSGKARAQGVAATRARAVWEGQRGQTSRRQASAPKKEASVTQGTVTPAQMPQVEMPQVPAPSFDDEDELGTVVVEADFTTQSVVAGQVATTTFTSDGAPGAVVFHVVKNIVLCDSNQIIAAEEGVNA
ncbi:MAG: hypothetical protein Q4D48_05635 [Coriobacteriales bacterium]|nr:hypothetical protein [Coriobacteriales bacterium]